MVFSVLSRAIAQSVMGLTCLTLFVVALPSPTRAQPGDSTLPSIGPTASPPGAVQTDYILGGGDSINVRILDVPEYSGQYQIPPGGIIYFPLIGSVSLQGLTQTQASDLISAKYSRFLKRPLVSVSLITPRPITVSVSGEVNSPGSYQVISQAGGTGGIATATLVTAIVQAGGVSGAADISQVQLRRKQGLGLPDQNFTVDLRNLVRTGNSLGDITLRDGDIIFIPTATSGNLADIRQFSTANFAAPQAAPRTVTVVGQVNRPGPYVVVGGATSGQTTLSQGGIISQGTSSNTTGLPTVTRAIQLAGGITSDADIRNIQIRRPTRSGPDEIIKVNLMQLLTAGDVNQDTVVQQGDSVIVPKATALTPAEQTQLASANFSPDTIQVGIVGEVKTPGVIKIAPNTPLNQAILTAGGFNNGRANRKAVDIIRLNPNGTVTKRTVKINLASNLNEQGNPPLRNNDVVVVYRNGLAKTGDTLSTIFEPFGSLFSIFGIVNAVK